MTEHEKYANTIGTCSKCGGPVVLQTRGTPCYMCDQCGAAIKHSEKVVGMYGPVIDMGKKNET